LIRELIAGTSPRLTARIAGVFYLLNFITAPVAYFNHGHLRMAFVFGLLATASYVAVTVLFYYLFKPVNRNLSLLAMVFSLLGSALGVLSPLHFKPAIDPLVCFGFYCLLIGYLILRSKFLPHFLGVLMAVAGLGWLAFISRPFAHSLAPYNLISGGIGEGALTLWLVFTGVNTQRWNEQASA